MILSGIRILDFGRYLAGPFCAALLGDLGADVIRVEKIGGSEDRDLMPVSETGDVGAMFLQVNRNKRSITLDPAAGAGRQVLAKLVARSDVVIANMTPRALATLEMDYESLRAIKPDIILTTATAFDPSGPDRDRVGFDGVGQAISGAISLTGEPGKPMRAAVSYVDYATAISCAYGTLAAIIGRYRTGQGQHVQASLMATALTIMNPLLIEQAIGGRTRVPTANRSPIAGPSDLFATRDGWIIVQVIGNPLFRRWAGLVGAEHVLADPCFKDDLSRGKNGEALSEMMSVWCKDRTTAEALDELDKVRIPGAPVLTPLEVLDYVNARSSGMFKAMEYPGLSGPAPIVGDLVHMSGQQSGPFRRSPTTGEHTDEVLVELGYDLAGIAQLREAGAV